MKTADEMFIDIGYKRKFGWCEYEYEDEVGNTIWVDRNGAFKSIKINGRCYALRFSPKELPAVKELLDETGCKRRICAI